MMTELLTKKLPVLALVMTLLLGDAAYAKGRSTPHGSAQPVSRSRGDGKKRIATARFVRTELFFGSDRPDSPDVTEEQFRVFIDKYVTPEFPDGLTVLVGKGQFCCGAGGAIIQETSFVLILLYPFESAKESSENIEKIREAYKTEFKQQSVLRVDDPRPVRVSF
jgi:hypothetical protein